jgi:hypothetical protein
MCSVTRFCREWTNHSALLLATRHTFAELPSAYLTFEFSHAILLSYGFFLSQQRASSAVKLFPRCPFHIPVILTGYVTFLFVLHPRIGIAPSFVLMHDRFIMLFRYPSSGVELWLTGHGVIAMFFRWEWDVLVTDI